MNRTAFLSVTTVALLVAATAGASPIAYYDRATFNSAVGMPFATVTFEGIAPESGYVQFRPPVTTIGGVAFAQGGYTTDYLIVVSDTYPSGPTDLYDFGTGDSMQSGSRGYSGSGSYLQATFPFPVNAFGVDLFTVAPNATPLAALVSVGLSSGSVVQIATNQAMTTAFLGVIAQEPIAWVRFAATDQTSYVDIDNLSYPVPEPATLLLLGTGVAAASVRRRRRPR
jgi:hypothetical protein